MSVRAYVCIDIHVHVCMCGWTRFASPPLLGLRLPSVTPAHNATRAGTGVCACDARACMHVCAPAHRQIGSYG